MAASVALLGLIALAAWSAWQEIRTLQAEERYERQSRLIDSGFDGADIRDVPPAPQQATARQLLIDSLLIARAADTMPAGPERVRLTARARAEAYAATLARPHWADGQIAVAYAESLDAPLSGSAEREALIRSYDDAPYLPSAGVWRLTRGLADWARLPARTQRHIADETVWYICTKPSDFRHRLFDSARESDGYRTVFLTYGRSRGCRMDPHKDDLATFR